MTRRRILEAFRNWLDSGEQPNNYALTITLKQGYKNTDGGIVRLNQYEAGRIARRIMNKINYCVFKKGAKRKICSIGGYFVCEGGADKRLHLHGAIALPDFFLEKPDHLALLANIIHGEQDWVHDEIVIRPIHDNKGWIQYTLKEGYDNVIIGTIRRPIF